MTTKQRAKSGVVTTFVLYWPHIMEERRCMSLFSRVFSSPYLQMLAVDYKKGFTLGTHNNLLYMVCPLKAVTLVSFLPFAQMHRFWTTTATCVGSCCATQSARHVVSVIEWCSKSNDVASDRSLSLWKPRKSVEKLHFKPQKITTKYVHQDLCRKLGS